MPSVAPSWSNSYNIGPDHNIDPPTFNLIFSDIKGRLATALTAVQEYDDAIALLSSQALTDIAVSLAPQLQNLRDEMTAIQDEVQLAEDQLAALQTGGVKAENVPLANTSYWPANTDAQEAFVLFATRIAGINDDLDLLEGAIDLRVTAIEARLTPFLMTGNGAAVVGRAYRIMTAGLVLTLPENPNLGDTVRVLDGGVLSPSAVATIARNGKTIMGLAENLTVNRAGADFSLWYNGTTWRLF